MIASLISCSVASVPPLTRELILWHTWRVDLRFSLGALARVHSLLLLSSKAEGCDDKRERSFSEKLELHSFSTVRMLCAQMYIEKERDSESYTGNTKIIFLPRWLMPLFSSSCVNLSLSKLASASVVIVSYICVYSPPLFNLSIYWSMICVEIPLSNSLHKYCCC